MKDFLFGNVLGISNMDLRLTGLITLYTLVCISAFYRFFLSPPFNLLWPVRAASMPTSCTIFDAVIELCNSCFLAIGRRNLVVAMLIIPVYAYLLTSRLNRMLWLALP